MTSTISRMKANWRRTWASRRGFPKSNETEHSGRITKCGSRLGRTALLQCGLIAQRYSPYFKQFYQRIKAKKGAGKAIIVLARKLLGITYRTLKNNWVFEDFPNFVLAEA